MEASPSGLVTFLLTDVEGSTGLWERDEPGMDDALARHDDVMRGVIAAHGGHVFSTAGDSFAVAFATPMAAVDAAVDAQRSLGRVGLRVRMGIHMGEAHERDGDFFGPVVNRTARIMAAAHGGQVLVSTPVAELVGDRVDVGDLGDHRLRDLTAPVRLWQVAAPGLDDMFPPLRTLDHGRSNLPQQRTSLVGREGDIHALALMLKEAGIVTVTGVGGIGKTRLALNAAAEVLPDFAAGVWFAPLAPLDNPAMVADVVLAAMGGRRPAERPALDALAEFARQRRLLVVLDNCEHLLGAAAECAEAITAGGQSVVLATSREPLAIGGEHIFPVPALDDDAAVMLFTERARAVDPTFASGEDNRPVVEDLCRRLDRMPLALELAAARIRSMTVQEISERLDVRFRLLRGGAAGGVERHRTLQAAIQWSYDLLEPAEQALFASLSVFAGGFTLASVVAVVGAEGQDDVDMIGVLDALVGRSMVAADRRGLVTRYALLETIRQFGEDKLVALGDITPWRARHASHFLAVAEEARRRLSTPDPAGAMAVFRDEWDNLRTAFDWFASMDDVDSALRLVMAMAWPAILSWKFELLNWADQGLAMDGAVDHELWPAVAGANSILHLHTDDRAGGRSLAENALRMEAERGPARRFEPALARYLFLWGSRQTPVAVEALRDVETIAARTNDPIELGQAAWGRAVVQLVTDPKSDTYDAREAVRAATATANPHQLAFAYLGLLADAVGRGNRDEAVAAFGRAKALATAVDNRVVITLAPLFLTMTSPDDDPLEALSLTSEMLTAAYDAGFWANLDFALRRIILPLVRLDRARPAAVVLGGLTGLDDVTPDTQNIGPRATALLTEALGDEFAPLFNQGGSYSKHDLVRFALDQIDAATASA